MSSYQPKLIELLFSKKYHISSREHFYLDAVNYLQEALKSPLISKGRVFLCQVDDCITFLRRGFAYRAARVESIVVAGFTETKYFQGFQIENDYGIECASISASSTKSPWIQPRSPMLRTAIRPLF
ncbi:hypothetical protein N7533_012955 [Penicillium manginii]|uniref:uncharacterized protein n=1 Tax=Penicillium manginii TaxID=203109 RepID=UPI0025477C9A|nr:uncharacterized protein N7533_012955 [Penicillium manginii]KAJ5734552.1 hypothetical protein N7533_012955 [Penicillium manginii]